MIIYAKNKKEAKELCQLAMQDRFPEDFSMVIFIDEKTEANEANVKNYRCNHMIDTSYLMALVNLEKELERIADDELYDFNGGLKMNISFDEKDLEVTDEEIEYILAGMGDLHGTKADAYLYGVAVMYDLMISKINALMEDEHETNNDEMVYMEVVKPFFKDKEFFDVGCICGTTGTKLAERLIKDGVCKQIRPQDDYMNI